MLGGNLRAVERDESEHRIRAAVGMGSMISTTQFGELIKGQIHLVAAVNVVNTAQQKFPTTNQYRKPWFLRSSFHHCRCPKRGRRQVRHYALLGLSCVEQRTGWEVQPSIYHEAKRLPLQKWFNVGVEWTSL